MEKRSVSDREHSVEFKLSQLQVLRNALLTVIGEAKETFDQIQGKLDQEDNQKRLLEMVEYLGQVHARFMAAMPQFAQARLQEERVEAGCVEVEELLAYIAEFLKQ